MFKQLYLGELKKMFSLKTAIVMLVLFAVGFAVVGLALGAATDLMITSDVEDALEESEEEVLDMGNIINVSKVDAQLQLQVNRTLLEIAKAEKKELGYQYYTSLLTSTDTVYYYKSQVAIYEYIIDNELYDTNVTFYDSTLFAINFLSGQSAAGYAVTMLGIFAFLLTIYALIIGSGAYSNELRNGTLKIVLLNPISRNQLTLAKFLAMLTLVTGAFLIVCITVIAVSYGMYDDPAGKLLYVFNATGVFRAGHGFGLFLGIVDVYLSVLALAIMAFFFGTLTKKRIWGFVIPYGFSLTATIAGLVGIARFWPTEVAMFSGFFGPLGNLIPGSSFFLSLPLMILYYGGMIAGSFLIFNKRDVA